MTITPVGADPTLSLGEPTFVGKIGNPSQSGSISVPVLLDQPHLEGSTGMTEAILALHYDPSVLIVAAITLGSIPGQGIGWHLSFVVDQATGQIGITLYITTPMAQDEAGSLVNIIFYLRTGEAVGVSPRSARLWSGTTAVQLVTSVTAVGQQFATQVDDAQGQLVLSPGVEQVVLETGVGPLGVARSPRSARGR
jgi:hypothetical protein